MLSDLLKIIADKAKTNKKPLPNISEINQEDILNKTKTFVQDADKFIQKLREQGM